MVVPQGGQEPRESQWKPNWGTYASDEKWRGVILRRKLRVCTWQQERGQYSVLVPSRESVFGRDLFQL